MNISNSFHSPRISTSAGPQQGQQSRSGNIVDTAFGSINDFFERIESNYQRDAEPGQKFAPVRRSFDDAVHYARMDSAPKTEAGFALGGFGEVINWRNPSTLEHKAGVAEGEFGQPLGPESVKQFHRNAMEFATSIDQSPMDGNPEAGVVSYRQAPDFRFAETAHGGVYEFSANLNENSVSMYNNALDGGPLVFSPDGIARAARLGISQEPASGELSVTFSAEDKNGPLLQGNLSLS